MSEIEKHNHKPFTEAEERLIHRIEENRQRVNKRFPLWTALAATFGLVSIWVGMGKMIDKVPFFVNNPWVLIVLGILVLIGTGSTYKKL